MRDIEFLPAWYPAIRRRCRWVAFQGWITLFVVLLISGYALAKRLQVRGINQTTSQTQAQINLSRRQLATLSQKIKLEDELRQQDRIAARLGVGVETTRLLKALEQAMTPEMALTRVSLSTQEQPRTNEPVSRHPGNSDPVELDRRLKVVVDGVAPSEIQAVSLMGNLLKVSCFENVAIQLNQAKLQDGQMTQAFQVTFDMDLNAPAESVP
jgi:cytoskeletal protein RodZ